MRSSLKKSLYLGLAALSFASVAGAAFENTTASAKKTTKKAKKTTKKAAKKVTYAKVTSLVNRASQDSQPTAFTLTQGTLTNRPDGVKGSHAVATGLSSSDLYMAYQTATLNNGKTYYKVVSFTDKSKRGFVSTDAVKSVPTFTASVNNGNTTPVYLKSAQALYSYPKGSTFKDQVSLSASDASKYAKTQFGIAQTTTFNNTSYSYVIDLANPTVRGWVASDQLSSTANRYFDQNADIKVNFVNNSGQTVASQIVNISNLTDGRYSADQVYKNHGLLSNDRTLNNSFVASLFNKATNDNGTDFTITDGDTTDTDNGKDQVAPLLAKTGYYVSPADYSYSVQSIQNGSDIKIGDTVNFNVSAINTNQNQATSPLKFKAISPLISGSTVQWNPADAKDIDASSVVFANGRKYGDKEAAAYSSDFTGNQNLFVGTNNGGSGLSSIFANSSDYLFGNDGVLAYLQDNGNQNVTVSSISQYTNGFAYQSSSKFNNNVDGTSNAAFNDKNSGVLAFASEADLQKAAASVTSTYTLSQAVNDAAKSGKLTPLQIGRQYHLSYVIDRQATMQYNAWATLYGKPVTVVYDAVPVATPVSTTTSSSTNITNPSSLTK